MNSNGTKRVGPVWAEEPWRTLQHCLLETLSGLPLLAARLFVFESHMVLVDWPFWKPEIVFS